MSRHLRSARARAQAGLAVVSAAALGLGACTGEPDPAPPSMGALGSTAADLDRDVFLPGCAFAACHGAARPAAQLNLGNGICGVQMNAPSCLFPSKRLVVPGYPERSFLIDKLTGENLAAKPETDCSTTGNARMPYGGAALSVDTIERVQAWIRAGAPCPAPGSGGGSGGAAMTGIAPGSGGAGGAGGGTSFRLGFETATARVRSGARTTLTLTIAPAPGPRGVSVALSPDDVTALGVPGAVFIPAATTQVTFDVQGKRPSAAVNLTATVGEARAHATVTVDGLFIAEVFYGGLPVASPGDHAQWVKVVNITDAPIDLAGYQVAAGRAGATETALPLTGVLQPATCLVVGGSVAVDFVPDIPRVDPNKPGVVVALRQVAGPVEPAASLPLDAMIAGGPAAAVGADGSALATAAPALAPGHALARTGNATWTDLARPTPDACPRWW